MIKKEELTEIIDDNFGYSLLFVELWCRVYNSLLLKDVVVNKNHGWIEVQFISVNEETLYPFSILFFRSGEKRFLNFYINEAAVFEDEKVDNNDDAESLKSDIELCLSSTIFSKRVYCNNRLKKTIYYFSLPVSYGIDKWECVKHHENSIVCFRKREEISQYLNTWI